MSINKKLIDIAIQQEKVTSSDKSDNELEKKSSMAEDLMKINTGSATPTKNTRRITKLVDPSMIKLFKYRDRTAAWDNPQKLKDLIASIKKEGDQIVPAIVRPTNDKQMPFELIVGGRRYMACKHNGIRLEVEVRDLTDREAAKLVNAENEDREDVMPFEKALHAYNLWGSGIYIEKKELSDDFNIPAGTLTERLQAASITEHEDLYSLLEPVIDINVKKAIKVAQGFAKKETKQKTLAYIRSNFSKDSQLVGEPNKILDDVIRFIETLSKPKATLNKIVHESIKVDGAKAVIKRDRKGKVKIELDNFPDNAVDFFAKLAEKASKLM